MKTAAVTLLLLLGVATIAVASPNAKSAAKSTGEWNMNATIIEACSCPMFCSCYFGSGHPAGHHDANSHTEEHFCKFNNAIRVNHGSYKGTKLDGAKFWVGGDLGGDFSKGQMDWAVLTFDKAVTPAQREGILAIAPHIYPVKWNSFTTGEGDMSWDYDAAKGVAVARLDGGKTAEVRLERGSFGEKGKIPVINGLQYWGVDHNDGFVLMPNSVEAYRVGEKPFEYNNTNGFMITFDIADRSAPAAGGKTGY